MLTLRWSGSPSGFPVSMAPLHQSSLSTVRGTCLASTSAFRRLVGLLRLVVSALPALSKALLRSGSSSDWGSYLIFFMFLFAVTQVLGFKSISRVTDQCVFVCLGLSPRRQVCDNRLSTCQHEELGHSDGESLAVEVHHDRGRNTFMRSKEAGCPDGLVPQQNAPSRIAPLTLRCLECSYMVLEVETG